MNLIKILTCIVLVLIVPTKAYADLSDSTNSQCKDVRLLKDVPIDQLAWSSNASKEPFFMAESFCFIYYTQNPQQGAKSALIHKTNSKYWTSRMKGQNILSSYDRAYASLHSLEQRLNFIHLYLVQLTHNFVVTPYAFDKRRAQILIFADIKPDYHLSIKQYIARDMGDLEALHKLNQMQDNPPKAEDYPVLSKLVDTVLEGKEVISDDKLYEITSKL